MVLWNRVKGHYFRGTISATFKGDRQAKKILENMEHRENNFRFLRNRGTSILILRDYVPAPLPMRASMVSG